MRHQGIELLRVILMFLVVTEHVIGHGMGALDVINGTNGCIETMSLKLWACYAPCIMAVDCFVFISGFWGIHFNIKRIITLIIQSLSTSLILLLIANIFRIPIGGRMIVSSLAPIITNYWWFLTDYLVLFCISPLLNVFVTMDKMIQRTIMLILFGVNCFGGLFFGSGGANLGYSILNFIFLYLLGQYLNQHKVLENRVRFYLLLNITLSAILIIASFMSQNVGPVAMKRMVAYNNPLVILCAVTFFAVFYRTNFHCNISKLSRCSLGIYLFSDSPLLRSQIPAVVSDMGGAVSIVLIFFSSLIAEVLRTKFVEATQIQRLINKYVIKL